MINCVIDNREKYLKTYFLCKLSKNIIYETKQLNLGDVHIFKDNKLVFIIERKTLSDFAASIKDGRYVEQKSRLDKIKKKAEIIYIVEGELNLFSGNRINGILTKAIQSAMIKLQLKHKFSVIQTSNTLNTCEVIQKILDKFIDIQDETNTITENDALILQQTKKKYTSKNCLIAMLCQIPGISINKATAITNVYPTIFILIEAYNNIEKIDEKESMLQNILVNSRKLGLKLSSTVYNYLLNA